MGEEEGLLFFVSITLLTITCSRRGIYLFNLLVYSLFSIGKVNWLGGCTRSWFLSLYSSAKPA